VAVDLGDKGILFALLKDDDTRHIERFSTIPPALAVNAFRHLLTNPNTSVVEDMSILKKLKPKTELMPEQLPMLVRFRDINDPTTAENVDPRNLAKNFGLGVTLVSSIIEITNDPVTEKIDLILPSWKGTNFNKWQSDLQYGHPLRFSRSDFKGAF
jgi:hypothetical protein